MKKKTGGREQRHVAGEKKFPWKKEDQGGPEKSAGDTNRRGLAARKTCEKVSGLKKARKDVQKSGRRKKNGGQRHGRTQKSLARCYREERKGGNGGVLGKIRGEGRGLVSVFS